MKKDYIVLSLFICASCASIVVPTGGPVDRDPPELTSASPPHLSVNVWPKEVILSFDEFIDLTGNPQDWNIYPDPGITRQNIRVHKNSIRIKIPDSLKAQTTYYWQFPQKIQDVHEGNKLDYLDYAFSTGSQIDTLIIQGRVISALTGLHVENPWVILFQKRGADWTPDRWLRGNDQGQFTFSYLPQQEYRLLAISDENKNKQWNPPLERLGMIPHSVQAQADQQVQIQISAGKKFIPADSSGQQKSDTTENPGIQNKEKSSAVDQPLGGSQKVSSEFKTNLLQGVLDPETPLILFFEHSTHMDYYTNWVLLYDSQAVNCPEFCPETKGNYLIFRYLYTQSSQYILKWKKGDTPDSLAFKIGEPEQYARLILQIEDSSDAPYLYFLVSEKERINLTSLAAKEPILAAQDTKASIFPVRPDNYFILRVQDTNGNNTWDDAVFDPLVFQRAAANQSLLDSSAMNIYQSLPEETRWTLQPFLVRANWELELKLSAASWDTPPAQSFITPH